MVRGYSAYMYCMTVKFGTYFHKVQCTFGCYLRPRRCTKDPQLSHETPAETRKSSVGSKANQFLCNEMPDFTEGLLHGMCWTYIVVVQSQHAKPNRFRTCYNTGILLNLNNLLTF